jgi:hypothetical protein
MKLRKPIFLLLLLAVPGTCFAEAGQVSGELITAFFVVIALGWTLFCILVFFLFRKLIKWSRSRSFFLSFIVFLAPVIYISVIGVSAYLKVEAENPDPETATSPVTLAGVVFPAGSRMQYKQNNVRSRDKELVQVESNTPVMMGPFSITGLKVDADSGTTGIILYQDHVIDGWPCAAVAGMWTEIRLIPQLDHPLLDSCWLSEDKMIGGVTWPAGTSVSAAGGLWMLLWRRNQGQPANAFGFPLDYMSATYNTKLELDLSGWEGQSYDATIRTGDYVFPRDTGAHIAFELQPGRDIRVEGPGKNVKTGKAVPCVFVAVQNRQSRPCKPDAN